MSIPLPQLHWTAADGTAHHGPVLAAKDGFDIVACAHCGFSHALPLPTPQDLQDTYAHDYYSSEKPLYIARYEQDRDWWNAVYDERCDRLEQHLPADRRRLLDVGSGPGLFLQRCRSRGWQVRGIEPSTQAATYSRDTLGLDITQDFLDERLAQQLGRFDAVNLGEVLEHLSDPAAMLRLVHGLLDTRGLVCVVVPNDFNPLQQIAHEHGKLPPWWVAPPHHLNYFDATSLAALMERCGFRVVHREVTFPIDLFLLMGKPYIGNDTLGRECHGMRMAFETAMRQSGQAALMQQLYQGFLAQGLGRELVFFGEKA